MQLTQLMQQRNKLLHIRLVEIRPQNRKSKYRPGSSVFRWEINFDADSPPKNEPFWPSFQVIANFVCLTSTINILPFAGPSSILFHTASSTI